MPRRRRNPPAIADHLGQRLDALQHVFDSLPVMINVFDATGHITHVNREWERTLGWSLGALRTQNQDIFALVFPDPRERQRALDFVAAATGEWENFSLRVRDGRTLQTAWARFKLDDEINFSIGQDVTERARSEELLREAQRRTESILASVTDTHIVFDRQWCYVYVNAAAERAIGRPREQVIGRTLWELYPDVVDTEFDRQFRRAMEERIPAAFEFHYVPLDSWWENRFNPIPEGLAVFATDITERKRAEAERQRAENETRRSQEQLRALSAHLQTVREEERTHIAREIHDELGQVLTRLKMELSLLEESWHVRKDRDPVPSDEQALRRMVTLVDGSIQTVRKIATELRPTMLDTLGLSAAIEWQAQEFLETSGISCAVSLPDDEWTVDREISTALFRILQESLTNVVRHARARNVSVALWNDGHATTLEVEDDGVGISPELIGGPKFFGLLSMKERALVLGGTLDVTRGQDGGTKIVARIPHVAEAARTHLP